MRFNRVYAYRLPARAIPCGPLQDMATGMTYLSEQGIQHRNLHSHNVLITKEWGAKVGGRRQQQPAIPDIAGC